MHKTRRLILVAFALTTLHANAQNYTTPEVEVVNKML